MKRLLMLSVLSLTAVFLVTSIGQAAGSSKSSTTSKVSPSRDKTKSYRFKTTGRVLFPTAFCPPNQPSGNCLALRCPAGVTNAKYCSKPTVAQVCSGNVRIVFKRGTRTVFSKRVALKADCKYSSTATIRSRGRMKVSVSFGGNTVLGVSKASRKNARAG